MNPFSSLTNQSTGFYRNRTSGTQTQAAPHQIKQNAVSHQLDYSRVDLTSLHWLENLPVESGWQQQQHSLATAAIHSIQYGQGQFTLKQQNSGQTEYRSDVMTSSGPAELITRFNTTRADTLALNHVSIHWQQQQCELSWPRDLSVMSLSVIPANELYQGIWPPYLQATDIDLSGLHHLAHSYAHYPETNELNARKSHLIHETTGYIHRGMMEIISWNQTVAEYQLIMQPHSASLYQIRVRRCEQSGKHVITHISQKNILSGGILAVNLQGEAETGTSAYNTLAVSLQSEAEASIGTLAVAPQSETSVAHWQPFLLKDDIDETSYQQLHARVYETINFSFGATAPHLSETMLLHIAEDNLLLYKSSAKSAIYRLPENRAPGAEELYLELTNTDPATEKPRIHQIYQMHPERGYQCLLSLSGTGSLPDYINQKEPDVVTTGHQEADALLNQLALLPEEQHTSQRGHLSDNVKSKIDQLALYCMQHSAPQLAKIIVSRLGDHLKTRALTDRINLIRNADKKMREQAPPESTQTIPDRAKELAGKLAELREQRENNRAEEQGVSRRTMRANRRDQYLKNKAAEFNIGKDEVAKKLLEESARKQGKTASQLKAEYNARSQTKRATEQGITIPELRRQNRDNSVITQAAKAGISAEQQKQLEKEKSARRWNKYQTRQRKSDTEQKE